MFNNEAAKELANAVKEIDLSIDQKIALAAVFAHLDANDATREQIALGARMAGVSEEAIKHMRDAMDELNRDMRGEGL